MFSKPSAFTFSFPLGSFLSKVGNALSLSSPIPEPPPPTAETVATVPTVTTADASEETRAEPIEIPAPQLGPQLCKLILSTAIAHVSATTTPESKLSTSKRLYNTLARQRTRRDFLLDIVYAVPGLSMREKGLWVIEVKGIDVYAVTEQGGTHLKQLDYLAAHDIHPWSPKRSTLTVRASQLNRLDSLAWWLHWHKSATPETARRPFPAYDARVLVAASAAGHVGVLDFWRDSGFKFDKHMCQAIDQASAKGHVTVLWWWYRNSRRHVRPESRVLFRYSQAAMDLAAKNGHVHVLRWWHQRSNDRAKPYIRLLFTKRKSHEARRIWSRQVMHFWQSTRLMGW